MKKTAAMLILGVLLGLAAGAVGSQWFSAPQRSPYLENPNRLADVVAAIQMMGTYKWDSECPDLPPKTKSSCADPKGTGSWEYLIGASPKSTELWSTIFLEHPEFFRRNNDGKVALVLRRAGEWTYDTVTGKTLKDQDEIELMRKDTNNPRLSRTPLTPEQITALIQAAVQIQTQAIAVRQESRWWVPVVVGLLGVLIGALLKS